MLEISFSRFINQTHPDRVQSDLQHVLDCVREERYLDGLKFLFDRLEVTPMAALKQEYYRSELFYYLGLFLLRMGRTEGTDFLHKSALSSAGDFTGLVYSDHALTGKQNFEKQALGMARKIPALYITSLPKSASSFVSQVLAEALDIPMLRTSAENFPLAAIVPSWLQQVTYGGCVTHEHFDAGPYNRGQLQKCVDLDLFVQVRDPRECAWSLYHHTRKMTFGEDSSTFEECIDACYPSMSDWIFSWITPQTVEALQPNVRLHCLQYADLKKDPDAFFMSILDTVGLGGYEEKIQAVLARFKNKQAEPSNFRSGDSEEWRKNLSPQKSRELFESTPAEVREFLRMRP